MRVWNSSRKATCSSPDRGNDRKIGRGHTVSAETLVKAEPLPYIKTPSKLGNYKKSDPERVALR